MPSKLVRLESFPGWPNRDSKEIMFLSVTPQEISKSIGSVLDRAEDELESFTVTFFEVHGIGPAIIYMHDSNIGSSTVTVDTAVPEGAIEEAIIDMLGLTLNQIMWRLGINGPFEFD